MTALDRLCLAAIRHHEAVRRVGTVFSDDDAFMRADQELIEAAAAYTQSLTLAQRRRIRSKGHA